jgi:RNA polymerase sigma-70 factor (ECF subfamily)
VAAGTMLADEALRQTGEQLLEGAVHDHSRLIYRVAFSILRNHHDAEDVTQETFVRAMRQVSKLGEIEDMRAWLARIAWRIAVDRKPSARHSPIDDLALHEEVRSSEPGADDLVLENQLQTMLEPMIGSLPIKLRGPLVLSTIEELSPRAVAAMLGINDAAVRSRLFRARTILREKLQARLGKKL